MPKPTTTCPATERTTYFAVIVKLFQIPLVGQQLPIVLQADEVCGLFDDAR